MITLKQYDELIKQTLKYINKINNTEVKEIITEIDSINDLIYLCDKKIMPNSTLLYKIRTLKTKYYEQINKIISFYHNIIFPDLGFTSDANNMINGPYSLKLWLTRYLCYMINDEEITQFLNNDFYKMSVTEQFQFIDLTFFNLTLRKKVL